MRQTWDQSVSWALEISFRYTAKTISRFPQKLPCGITGLMNQVV